MSECKYCGGAKTWGSLKAEMVNNGLTNLANKYREKCSSEGYPYITNQRLSVFVNNLIKTFDKYEKEKLKYQQETYLLQKKLNKAYSKLQTKNTDPKQNIDQIVALEAEISELRGNNFSLTQKNQELSNQVEKLKTLLQERKKERNRSARDK